MKKKLLLGLLSFSLFDVKALSYGGFAMCSIVIGSGMILEHSRANWNTERKTVKEKVFYYSKLVPAAFVSFVSLYMFLRADLPPQNK